jgi:aldehyde dehydrogenase (NAD+)
MDDGDLDIAVAAALGGAFGGTGQKCTASSRLVVHAKIHDEFVEKLTAGASAMVVDNALKDGTQIGPVVSQTQLDENLAWVERAKAEGGDILCGGERVARHTDGYYMTPAVVAGTQNSWQINREEMFAPIACVIKVDSYDEAVDVVNDTHFGLTSGIITRSLARATDFRRRAETGVVTINLPTAGTDYHVPFGGRGSSSYGPREQGSYAQEFYTTVKTSYIAAGQPD